MQVDDEHENNAHVAPFAKLFNKLPAKSKEAVKPLLQVGLSVTLENILTD